MFYILSWILLYSMQGYIFCKKSRFRGKNLKEERKNEENYIQKILGGWGGVGGGWEWDTSGSGTKNPGYSDKNG